MATLIGWPLGWVVRWVGKRTLVLWGLLLAALGSVTFGLAGTIRGLDDRLMLAIAAGGMLAGWWLATRSLPAWRAGLLGLGLGLAGVSIRVGRLEDDLWAIVRAAVIAAWQGILWLRDRQVVPDGTPALTALGNLGANVAVLANRVVAWTGGVVEGRSTFDPVASALVWGMAVWVVSLWAGWMVRHTGRVLYGVVPAGVLLSATLSYAGANAYVLLILLAATLLLMACLKYDTLVRGWQKRGIDYAELGVDVAVVVGLLVAGLVVVSAIAPSISWQRVTDFVQRVAGDGDSQGVDLLAESLGVETHPQSTPESVFSGDRAGGLPRRHLIGAGPELSEQVVMVVKTGDLQPGPPREMRDEDLPRYYWRGVTYDWYNGRGWYSRDWEEVAYQASQPAITSTLLTQRKVRQSVRVVADLGDTLHVAGTLVAVDHDYRVAWRPHRDFFAAKVGVDGYWADSLVSNVSQEELRSAGTEYPAWILDRYLPLPEAIPARVRSLAYDLTAVAPTPYDRVRAIEAYLRQYPYTLEVPKPPTDRDVVDYFLFDLQEGYCDYYASAMAVLARAAGVPARLVVGYTSGEYDAASAVFLVSEANAHAWVEVYFPGYGWVEFEPTAGVAPIERPTERGLDREWLEPVGDLPPARPRRGWLPWSWWLVFPAGALLLGLVGVMGLIVDGWYLRSRRPAGTLGILYRRLRRHGRRLEAPVETGDTPYEVAAVLGHVLGDLADRWAWGDRLAPAAGEGRRLIALHVRASYSPRPVETGDRAEAIAVWARLRWRLWLAWAAHRWPRGAGRWFRHRLARLGCRKARSPGK